MKNKIWPVICILLAGSMWGCISIFLKGLPVTGLLSGGLNGTGLSVLGVAAVRMIFAAILYTVFMLITDREKLKINIKDIWMFALSGIVSMALFNFLYTYTVIHSEASVGVVLLYTSPIFTMILAAIFFKEKLTARKIIALVVVFAGCIFVSGLIGGSVKLPLLVLITGLGSGLFWGAYTIFSRITLKKYNSGTATVWSIIMAGVVMIPFVFSEKVPMAIAANPKIIMWGVGIGIFCTVVPYALYTFGLKYVESSKASIIVTIELIVGNLVGFLVFKEPISVLKMIGILLIASAIVILNIKTKEKNKNNC